jgi:ComF family protein
MDICAGCSDDLPWLGHACRHCALPLRSGINVCGRCQIGPMPVDRCVAALLYEYPVDRLIGALKFQKRLCLARVLAELLVIKLTEHWSDQANPVPDLLLPVPMHAQRMAERSFNQAAEIAARVARRLQLKSDAYLGLRTKLTRPQTGLNRRSRMRNLGGAFALSGSVKNLHVAIVDDVITTGTTTTQLARVCKSAGAAKVEVWAVARTP